MKKRKSRRKIKKKKNEEDNEPQPGDQLVQGDDLIKYKCISFKRGEQITYEIKSIYFQKKNDDLVGIAFWIHFSNKSNQKLVPLSELWEASNQEAREMLLKELRVQKRKFPHMAKSLQAVFDAGAANENGLKYHDIDNPEYTSGVLKYKDMRQVYNFEPELIDFESTWHTGLQTQRWMDCVIHAVNMLLGFPYFKSKEQFLKLYCYVRSSSISKEGPKKAVKGLRLAGLHKFITGPECTYSPKLQFIWDAAEIESNQRRHRYITHELEDRQITHCIVFVSFPCGQGFYSHAVVLKSID